MDKNKDCQCKHGHGHQGGGFQNGLVFGLILGAAGVFLLGTTKGKQILKALAENGFEEFAELLEDDEASESYEEYMEEVPSEEPGVAETQLASTETGEKPVVQSSSHVVHRSPVKRFFRGIKK